MCARWDECGSVLLAPSQFELIPPRSSDRTPPAWRGFFAVVNGEIALRSRWWPTKRRVGRFELHAVANLRRSGDFPLVVTRCNGLALCQIAGAKPLATQRIVEPEREEFGHRSIVAEGERSDQYDRW